ncbi:MAG: DUF1614 domain-containing protein [Gammaproteobacteria bacterium]|nr:MAG: DUF1614 domain-containing protein [Gammaproteobacteria bacterium]
MPPRYLLVLLFLVIVLVTIIQLEVLSIAFQKLGLSPRWALLLVLGALFGSSINIPVTTLTSTAPPQQPPEIPLWGRVWKPVTPPAYTGKTILAVNVGGCIIPLGLCLNLLARQLVNPLDLLPALLIVAAVSYLFSRPIPGIGIGMPVFIAPLVAVITALLLEPANAAPLAFSSGVLGVLLGADILHLRDIRKMGVRIASIGGAGTFDGVFLTGIIAVLLA